MDDVPAGAAAEPVTSTVKTNPGSGVSHADAPLRVEYYTDPLCCWSWALEPIVRQVRQHHGAQLVWKTVLGGMIESWSSFRDPMNDVAAPAQLAPLWHMAGRATGARIDPAIWHLDPPASSFPASVAVKAAELQGADAGEAYLRLVREAVTTRRQNVARRDVLLRVGEELAQLMSGAFDPVRFAADVHGEAALEAFRRDLQVARFNRIGRFPTFVVHGPAGSRIAVGYRPADALEQLLSAVAAQAPGALIERGE